MSLNRYELHAIAEEVGSLPGGSSPRLLSSLVKQITYQLFSKLLIWHVQSRTACWSSSQQLPICLFPTALLVLVTLPYRKSSFHHSSSLQVRVLAPGSECSWMDAMSRHSLGNIWDRVYLCCETWLVNQRVVSNHLWKIHRSQCAELGACVVLLVALICLTSEHGQRCLSGVGVVSGRSGSDTVLAFGEAVKSQSVKHTYAITLT